MAKALQGVMAALLTPFDHQQQLDSNLRRLVRFNIGQGIDGLRWRFHREAFVQRPC